MTRATSGSIKTRRTEIVQLPSSSLLLDPARVWLGYRYGNRGPRDVLPANEVSDKVGPRGGSRRGERRSSKRVARIIRYALRAVLITPRLSGDIRGRLCSFVPAHAAINIDYRDIALRLSGH